MKNETREQKIERHHKAKLARGWQEPSALFRLWWEPDGHSQLSGAQTGGHPAAYRKCVHRETNETRFYGIDTFQAFNTRSFREEFHQWLKDGQPERDELSDGTTAPQADVIACLENIKNILSGSPIMLGST